MNFSLFPALLQSMTLRQACPSRSSYWGSANKNCVTYQHNIIVEVNLPCLPNLHLTGAGTRI
jgi:hypothetical protein